MICAVMDAANARFGRDAVHLDACAAAPRRDAARVHQTRRAMLSPCYTTRSGKLAVAHARPGHSSYYLLSRQTLPF